MVIKNDLVTLKLHTKKIANGEGHLTLEHTLYGMGTTHGGSPKP